MAAPLKISGAVSSSRTTNPNRIVNLWFAGTRWKDLVPGIAPGVELFLEEEFKLSAENTYENPVKKLMEALKNAAEKATDAAGEVADGLKESAGPAVATAVGGGVKILQGIQKIAGASKAIQMATGMKLQTKFTSPLAWASTSTLKFSTSFKFYMGMAGAYSGRSEVMRPIQALAYICMPQMYGGGLVMYGPGPSFAQSIQAMASTIISGVASGLKGENPQEASLAQAEVNRLNSAAGIGKNGEVDTDIEAKQATQVDGTTRMIKMSVGHIFDSAQTGGTLLPTNFSSSYSKEVDSEGYPINGSVTIEWITYTVATASDWRTVE